MASTSNTETDTKQSQTQAAKACRVCSDFKSFLRSKLGGTDKTQSKTTNDKTPNQQTGSSEVVAVERTVDCPLNLPELGRSSWNFLHTFAAYAPDKPSLDQQKDMAEFMRLFGRLFPCETCADDFRQQLKRSPPDTTSRAAFSRWMCDRHNEVNRRLGKPAFDCDLVDQRWKDGWSDGSCS